MSSDLVGSIRPKAVISLSCFDEASPSQNPDSKKYVGVNELRLRPGRTARHAAKVDEGVMTVLRLSGSTTRKPVIAAAPASAAAQT
jgi:hypothetical protein